MQLQPTTDAIAQLHPFLPYANIYDLIATVYYMLMADMAMLHDT